MSLEERTRNTKNAWIVDPSKLNNSTYTTLISALEKAGCRPLVENIDPTRNRDYDVILHDIISILASVETFNSTEVSKKYAELLAAAAQEVTQWKG